MNDENGNDNGEPGFWDHMFNAFGNIAKAQRKAQAEAGAKRASKGGKRKLKIAFDEAPEPTSTDPACCTAKRGE